MSNRQGRTSKSQPQVVQPSDYDSDVSDELDAAVPPPSRTNYEVNMSVLKRYLSTINSIAYLHPYAVVYVFSSALNQWEKYGVEGTLFVCRRSPVNGAEEGYSAFVLNRRGLNNFTLDLRSTAQIEPEGEFIVLQSVDGEGDLEVYGLWIWAEPTSLVNARANTARALQECASKAQSAKKRGDEQLRAQDLVQEHASQLGRQISMQDLFGQQPPDPSPSALPSLSQCTASSQFAVSADTEFFRSAKSHAQHKLSPLPKHVPPPVQDDDVLGNLFRNAELKKKRN